MPFSLSAGIGFIALSGVAVLDDMILVSCVRGLQKARHAAGTGNRGGGPDSASAHLDDHPCGLAGVFTHGTFHWCGRRGAKDLATVVIGGVIPPW